MEIISKTEPSEKNDNEMNKEIKTSKLTANEFKPITPEEFMKNPQILDKVKLPQLRANLKHYKQMLLVQLTY